MYLSRLYLNVRNRQVQNELANRYELHRTLLKAFPQKMLANERVLFRVEEDGHSGLLAILVQSEILPDWAFLQSGYLVDKAVYYPQVKSLDPKLHAGQVLWFRLIANPTRRISASGARVGLMKEEDQHKWLEYKSGACGFTLQSVQVTPRGNIKGHCFKEGKRLDLTLLGVQFDGLLEIKNVDDILKTLRQGIGSGKGFGFGLLSLARAS